MFNAGNAKPIPDAERVSEHMGMELSKIPIELKSGDWALKVIPWIGGRIISMEHLPSGTCNLLCGVQFRVQETKFVFRLHTLTSSLSDNFLMGVVIVSADHLTSNLFVFYRISVAL